MNNPGYNDVWIGIGVVVAALVGYFLVIPAGVDAPSSVPFIALAPAFWPNIIMGLLVLLGVVLCVQGMMSIRAESGMHATEDVDDAGIQITPQRRDTAARLFRTLLVMALLFVYYAGLSRIGFVLASMLVLPVYMVLAGVRNVALIGAITLLLPIALYYFFTVVAKVAVPLGVLENIFS